MGGKKMALAGLAAALLFTATAQALTSEGVRTGRSDTWLPAFGVDPPAAISSWPSPSSPDPARRTPSSSETATASSA
jgi:hypothetical protein